MLSLDQSTNLVLVHDDRPDRSGESLIRYALGSEPLAGVIVDGLCRSARRSRRGGKNRRFPGECNFGKTIYAMPESWRGQSQKNRTLRGSNSDAKSNIVYYKESVPLDPEIVCSGRRSRADDSWFVVSNGRFVTQIAFDLIEKVLTGANADVLAVNTEPALLGEQERMLLTGDGNVAGFRRVYSDSAEFALVPTDWPHHLFMRAEVLGYILTDGALPHSFSAFSETCRSEGLELRAVNMGGVVLDLEAEDGMLSFCRMRLSPDWDFRPDAGDSNSISPDARLIGKVLLGRNIDIGPKAIIIGPTIVCDDAKIESGAIIDASIIGGNVCVPQKQLVRSQFVEGPQFGRKRSVRRMAGDSVQKACSMAALDIWQGTQRAFRSWPKFSYARCIKRIADCFGAMMVLLLFAPLMPFVALAIKLTSPGPVFYRDKRQGLHGKEFGCLKFRTMVTGADRIQDQLRIVSQVDGPQFKMDDDPRISTVGRFLRETYIDEIPQFINVLIGQMSIVGPRPSPASENTLCPSWRDARLSVRPGITGLWQVHRTREPMKDFQEWIHYDTE
ncbi:MAG: sugar transferase, partial [Planctomycetota bacterium]|nr:sugar transferase [Planctomycetota bacterium]